MSYTPFKPDERQHSLDLLRGLFIILALLEHFCVFSTRWFVDYSERGIGFEVDSVLAFIGFLFMPWVVHIYIHLAAFNLVRRSPTELRTVLFSKLSSFLAVFLLIFLMNALTFDQVGAKLSFDRLHACMIALAVIASLYSYFGSIAVFVLFICSSLLVVFEPIQQWGFIMEWRAVSAGLEGFQYDGHIELFLATASLGALHGIYVFHLDRIRTLAKDNLFVFISGIGAFYYLLAILPGFEVDRGDYWATELQLSADPLGLISIWCLLLFITHVFLRLEAGGVKMSLPLLNWVGKASLFIYLVHKPLFMHLFGPLREFLLHRGFPYSTTWIDIAVYIALTLMICACLERSQTVQRIFQGAQSAKNA